MDARILEAGRARAFRHAPRLRVRSARTAAAFVDPGYAWPRHAAINPGDLRPAVGMGLRVLTPLGPFRLDYAIGKDGGRAHLTTGDPF